MAPSFRTLCVIAAASTAYAALGLAPAGAQFINPFEALFGSPPRPPAGVPGGRPQPAPPPQQAYPPYPEQAPPDSAAAQPYPSQSYPGQPYPGQARQGAPGGVQSQSLPPPEGATAAADPRAPAGPQLLPGQRPPPGAPQPGASSVPPGDEPVSEPPSQKIANKGAMFSGLDKITGRIITFDAAIGETVQFGALQVTPRACYTRPPTETPNTDGFIEVDEVTLQGEVKRIFTGWMFAASPGLHGVEHPIYDIWLTDCKNPIVAAAPPPAEPPPAAQPAKPPTATPARRGSPPAPAAAPQPGAPPRR